MNDWSRGLQILCSSHSIAFEATFSYKSTTFALPLRHDDLMTP